MKSILTAICGVFCLITSIQASAVSLVCPPDKWLDCGAEVWDLSIYGQAYYYKNGQQYDAGTPTVVYNLTTCETGKIYRTWQVEDENWNIIECTQTITVGGGNFNIHNIHWPKDGLQLYGCNVNTHPDYLPSDYGRPTYDYLTCSMVGTSYKDQVFNFGPDCKKILRTWTVLDWCNYNTSSGNPGIWKYVQTIKVSGTNQPSLTCTPDVTLKALDCDSAYVDVPIVTVDEQACYGGYSITNDSPYALENGADATGTYPVGKTVVNYRIEYACGQETYCRTEVIVEEKGPVPYCLAKLTTSLMGVDTDGDGLVDDGMVELWAKDLDHASFHPCNNAPLKFSFSSNVDSTSRIFTCDDMGYNDLQLWVTDIYGNQAWCAVTLILQNNAANIPDCTLDYGGMVVNGEINGYQGEPLENVYVNLRSKGYQTVSYNIDTILVPVVVDSFYNAGGLLVHIFDYEEQYEITSTEVFTFDGKNVDILTDENGGFGTNEIERDRFYSMSAFKFGDITKIDQGDLEILSAYLENSYNFTNMYSYIAADINEDGIIDNLDLKLLRELYEEEEDEWPHERQWVFYNKADFENMEGNPLNENLSQNITIDVQQLQEQRVNMTGILKGDLSNYETTFKSDEVIESRKKTTTDNINIYPNPFANYFSVENKNSRDITVSVYTLEGKLIYSKVANNSLQIRESELWDSGSYIYTIISGEEVKSGKIIKL